MPPVSKGRPKLNATNGTTESVTPLHPDQHPPASTTANTDPAASIPVSPLAPAPAASVPAPASEESAAPAETAKAETAATPVPPLAPAPAATPEAPSYENDTSGALFLKLRKAAGLEPTQTGLFKASEAMDKVKKIETNKTKLSPDKHENLLPR